MADFCDRYRCEGDVRPLLDAILKPINERSDARGTMRLVDFVEQYYLPEVDKEKRAMTAKGYREMWENHIKDRVSDVRVRDFRTVDGSRLLKAIATANDLTKTTLQHIKSFLSGIFTFAKNEGLFDGVNPIQDVLIPKARRPAQTYAYSLWEIKKMLTVLPLTAKAAVGIAGYAGLSRSEIRGLQWSDYHNDLFYVARSVDQEGNVNLTKTEARQAPVPVIPELRRILSEYRASVENLSGPVLMFAGVDQPWIDMDKLARRVIQPIIAAVGLKWEGWHALRRGLATNLHDLKVEDTYIQEILRHANVSTTRQHYMKRSQKQTSAAMAVLQDEIEKVIVQ